ncbi:ImmA/IrrE family metallo-endopeptidase [Gracilibacillus salitolerans]|uniref:ImmA/IrrE family metallo-endopeptidase n=1 Tax=Gracilibacillus salitolerans TaxID=2663022 RepID=A0A5Q2TGP9_9BACI|nr:ImmA/IrrE family metallo-endopeptidase [Gracilibacillus salitolerans]QGH32578.1 ImmA/IrrE family metallo-endopeptidase [Gracilibacillus salitolerans]
MNYIYKPFDLENWITKHYIQIGITTPEQINLKQIALSFHIWTSYKEKRSFAFQDGKYRIINIDARLTEQEQREQFFHELCHLLRHCGSQLIMPKAFRELQEWDAIRFTKYAAIPYSMLQLFDLKSDYIIEEIAESFKVHEDLARERMEGIYRNRKPLRKSDKIG